MAITLVAVNGHFPPRPQRAGDDDGDRPVSFGLRPEVAAMLEKRIAEQGPPTSPTPPRPCALARLWHRIARLWR
jgi:hypothetical protein